MNHTSKENEIHNNIIPKEKFLKIIIDFKRQVSLQTDHKKGGKKGNALKWADDTSEWISSSNGNYESSFSQKLNELVQYSIQCEVQPVIAQYNINHPVYNYLQTFEENVDGPWDRIPEKSFVISKTEYSLLGFKIGYPIGVPASVLTSTPAWLEYYSKKGFNVLTFKTVRSKERLPHPNLNWVFLSGLNKPLDLNEKPEVVLGDINNWPENPKQFSMANSFGVPSFPPDVWEKDISETVKRLQENQILIVSVMGTSEEYSGEELINDFVNVSKRAEGAGAKIIELNLSCPNTVDKQSGEVKNLLICNSPKTTKQIVLAVRDGLLKETKLIIKLSYLPKNELKELLSLLHENSNEKLIDGVSGINTLQMEVKNNSDEHIFKGVSKGMTIDQELLRDKAGVSGVGIKKFGLDFVKSLNELRKEFDWKFDIIGMGGVMNAQDVFDYIKLGADAVQTATAAFFNPNLPTEISQSISEVFPKSELTLKLFSAIIEIVEESPKSIAEILNGIQQRDLISKNDLFIEKVNDVLTEMIKLNLVNIDYIKGQMNILLSDKLKIGLN